MFMELFVIGGLILSKINKKVQARQDRHYHVFEFSSNPVPPGTMASLDCALE
jgi:hypothetical protein